MSDIVICSNLRVQPDKSHSTERIQPEAAPRSFQHPRQQQRRFWALKKTELTPICLGFSSRICLTPELLRYGKGLSCVCDGCTNHQNNQIIDVFLWRLSSALLHFNASQRDSGWGMESAGRHFDTVCEQFITACVTQCPVPEVIYSLWVFATVRMPTLLMGNEVGVFCLFNQRFQHRRILTHVCFSDVH